MATALFGLASGSHQNSSECQWSHRQNFAPVARPLNLNGEPAEPGNVCACCFRWPSTRTAPLQELATVPPFLVGMRVARDRTTSRHSPSSAQLGRRIHYLHAVIVQTKCKTGLDGDTTREVDPGDAYAEAHGPVGITSFRLNTNKSCAPFSKTCVLGHTLSLPHTKLQVRCDVKGLDQLRKKLNGNRLMVEANDLSPDPTNG